LAALQHLKANQMPTASLDGPDEVAKEGVRQPTVWVARLQVNAFRSYRQAGMETNGRPVILTGPNGAGKTNLLEALSFLTPGRGLRGARLSEVDRRVGGDGTEGGETSQPWAVAAEVVVAGERRSLGTGRDPASPRDKRAVKLDGAFASSQQALGEVLSVVWLTPQMDRLFQEGPSERRRFLDRLVFGSDPAHAGRIAKYEQALRERSRLLRWEKGTPDPAWLTVLEETLAEQGVAIAAARCALAERLASACALAGGAFPRASLAVAGDVEAWLADMPALAVEDRLREHLRASRSGDAEQGGAAVGPHRSDLRVGHLQRAMPAELCSTGEQKALLIAIVLANSRLIASERGAAPLLLLDEVAAHLDEERRRALYDELLALEGQSWLTGTDPSLFDGIGGNAEFFSVREGRIAPDS
jgi:DNA replication and repair protein RecF